MYEWVPAIQEELMFNHVFFCILRLIGSNLNGFLPVALSWTSGWLQRTAKIQIGARDLGLAKLDSVKKGHEA